MTRTDVIVDVNWEGRETERGNVMYGWHLGTVCMHETECPDGMRYEVYVSHELQTGDSVTMHWSVFSDHERALARHEALVSQLKEVGEHGIYARRFDTSAQDERGTPG